ncbi:unnamed protein product [Protopolystoma xenopodis]|uniref:Dynein heavy chain ATP-binding dynein motor region domain-containing protein n=1 Tax=Protopolystoma xenopodis TaxID=117903 RepID=A0A3S5BP71_9PLAT|nr:unnamed protein product [Protopolystoma xenopodis]
MYQPLSDSSTHLISFLFYANLFFLRELVMRRDKFRNGLNKILETNDLVAKMEGELTAMRPKLEQKQRDTEELMLKLSNDQEQASSTCKCTPNEPLIGTYCRTQPSAHKQKEAKLNLLFTAVPADIVRNRVKEDELVAKNKAMETQAIADDAQRDLDEALPVLEASNRALDSLDKNDISELRVFTKPPQLVQTVMEAVCLMLGAKPDWASAKQLLSDGNFLKRLVDYPKDDISDGLLKKLKKYIDNPDFHPDIVEKTSKACKSMCMWVRALDLYAHVYRTVEPKRKRLNDANMELDAVMIKLRSKQAELKAVETKIAALQAEYDGSLSEKKVLEHSLALTSARLKRAGRLTTALADEQDRWHVSVDVFSRQLENVVGDVFVAAACIAYLGAFNADYRASLVEGWTVRCVELSIPISNQVGLFSVLGDAFELRQWHTEGLPRDQVSADNALLVTRSQRWPLMIDPQEQANRWIRTREAERDLHIVKLTESGFLRTLETCIRLGYPVLLEDVGETLDPALEPILLRQTFTSGGRLLIRLGDSNVDYDRNFRLYITTKLPNPHYLPEVSIKVTVINFTVTPAGLEDQLLGEVTRLERPELEEQRSQLVYRINADKNQLQVSKNDTKMTSFKLRPSGF